MWWEMLVKPGIKKLGIQRGKEVNRAALSIISEAGVPSVPGAGGQVGAAEDCALACPNFFWKMN